MSNSRDIIKGHLINNVKDLIVNLGVSHKEIINDIQDAVIELSKSLPKTQVLYNGTYGGYGLSEAFIDYVCQYEPIFNDSISNEARYRTQLVQYIIPFGHYVLQKYPLLKDLMVIYHHYNLNKIFYNIDNSIYLTERVQSLNERKVQLENILQKTYLHGTKTPKKYIIFDNDDDGDTPDDVNVDTMSMDDIMTYKYARLEGFTKETYEEAIECINKTIDEHISSIEKYKLSVITENQITEFVYDDMMQVITALKKQEDTNLDIYEYSLLEAINKFGVDDYRIWEFQHKYNKRALQYLLIKSQNYRPQETKSNDVYDFVLSNTYIKINDEDYNNIVKKFGLQCASSRYCSLKIGQVPQYVSWYIGEYDGLESICFH